jgi:hypothetical protein
MDQLCSHCGLQLLIYSSKLGFQGVLEHPCASEV